MKIDIYTNTKGKPIVTVEGSRNQAAKTVAKAYKEAVAELNNKEEK